MVPFDSPAAEVYGRIRHQLKRVGRLIPRTDLQIAAIALANEAPLVTTNTRHFKHIEGLVLEDWIV